MYDEEKGFYVCDYPLAYGGCADEGTVEIKHNVTDLYDNVLETVILGKLCQGHGVDLLRVQMRGKNSVEETNDASDVHTGSGLLREDAIVAPAGEGDPAGLAGDLG